MLRAAERVFAKKGFQDATISDVAREAKVSDATIYEYFPSKEELLFSIPGETARRGKENVESVLKFIRRGEDKIRCIIYHYLWFYKSHPDYASVAMLILKQNRKFLETRAYADVRQLSSVILDVIKEGMATGEFRPDTNPYLIRTVILGSIEHMVIRWVLLGKPDNLVEFVDPLTDLIVGGIGVREPEEGLKLIVKMESEGPAGMESARRSDLKKTKPEGQQKVRAAARKEEPKLSQS